MYNFLSSEMYKTRKTKPYKICLLLDVIYAVFKLVSKILYSWIYSSAAKQTSLITTYQNLGYDTDSIQLIIDNILHPSAFDVLCECGSGLIICGFFAGAFFAQDYKYGTFQQINSRGYSRTQIYGGKLLVSWVMTLTFTVVNVLIYFGGIAILFHLGETPENLAVYILRYIITVLLSSLLFTACAQYIAVLTKSIAGVIGCIALVNICGSALVTGIDMLMQMDISFDNYWFISVPYYMFDSNITAGEFMKYFGVALLYIVCFILLGYQKFKKQDL